MWTVKEPPACILLQKERLEEQEKEMLESVLLLLLDLRRSVLELSPTAGVQDREIPIVLIVASAGRDEFSNTA